MTLAGSWKPNREGEEQKTLQERGTQKERTRENERKGKENPKEEG
jgi:hypothetical protein